MSQPRLIVSRLDFQFSAEAQKKRTAQIYVHRVGASSRVLRKVSTWTTDYVLEKWDALETFYEFYVEALPNG